MVRELGVTKGSFYWHFKNLADFQTSLIRYWADKFTQVVAQRIGSLETSVEDRLLRLIDTVFKKDLARYDVAVRAWAAQDTALAKLVQQVDEKRMQVVRGLFEEQGFEGIELEMRTRCFVTFVSFDSAITLKLSNRKRLACLRSFHQLITSQ